MEENKIYVGNGKEKFDGDVVEFSLNLTKLKEEANNLVFDYSGNKYIKLKVCKKAGGVDEYGKTHYVQVDTWKPTPKQHLNPHQQSVAADVTRQGGEPFTDDVPF